MEACGLIVEYNPFHNGHLYHVQRAQEISNADCIIAVMSGSFLQRGEPAIIDKFHRTKTALYSGVDLVIELPYAYAVQSSELFAKGAVHSLYHLGVSTICFGSESGSITDFQNGVMTLQQNKALFDQAIRSYLLRGDSFPKASSHAYETIGLDHLDLFQPNNILGFSYVKTIVENNLPIQAHTIKRIKNDYHEQMISEPISSATSIRKEVFESGLSKEVSESLPHTSLLQFEQYKKKATLWHDWELYFPYLHYKVMTMDPTELVQIHGVDEGLEHRIKRTAASATTFQDWIEQIKTKRYTTTRLQRVFVHILTNTTKKALTPFTIQQEIPYIRLLGMNKTGQAFLKKRKKEITVPILTNLNRDNRSILELDEKATNVYYSILPATQRIKLRQQEFNLPLIV